MFFNYSIFKYKAKIRMGAFAYPEPKARVALFACNKNGARSLPHLTWLTGAPSQNWTCPYFCTVNILHPFFITTIVCSKWQDKEPSWVSKP